MSTAVFGAPEFTAKNGLLVRPCPNGGVEVGRPGYRDYTPPEATFALEEFFQAKRDADLGRWRYPLEPDYVVYLDAGTIYVLRESGGGEVGIRTFDASKRDKSRRAPNAYHAAAAAYLDAHPERKPWHNAVHGEFWRVVHTGGQVDVCRVDRDRFTSVMSGESTGLMVSMPTTHESITGARRMIVEEAS